MGTSHEQHGRNRRLADTMGVAYTTPCYDGARVQFEDTERPPMAKMILPLVYIPSDPDEPDNGRFMQSDSFVIMQFASDLDWLKHSKTERKAMIKLKRIAHEAHTAYLDEIEVTKAQVELLQKIIEEPMSHLKEKIKQAQGEAIDVEDQFVNTDLVQASLMDLEEACAGLLGTTVSDDEDEADEDVAAL